MLYLEQRYCIKKHSLNVFLRRIESGKSKPSLEGVFYIREQLGVTPSDFLDMELSNPSKLDAIIADMKKLNDKQLDTIAAPVKNLIRK